MKGNLLIFIESVKLRLAQPGARAWLAPGPVFPGYRW